MGSDRVVKDSLVDPVNHAVKQGQTVYSHSRLSTFEQCPLQFKFAYIDELKTDIEESIESFLGKRVHDVLEKLYNDLRFQKPNTLQELLHFYNDEWKKNWNEKILIVREQYDQENFRKMGAKFITDYYSRYRPFDQARTIGLEMRIMIKLDSEGKYMLQGFIDRLADAGDGVYEIHDYKTSNTLPEQAKIDADRQLALYSIAVREKFIDCRKVILIWHYLAFDKELRSERTEEQLKKLKVDSVQMINRIEGAKDFAPVESALCDWCAFRPGCPRFKHLFEVEDKEPEDFLADDGVKLVNEYAGLKVQEEELQKRIDELQKRIFFFSQQKKIDKLYGSDAKLTVWKKSCVKFPGKTDFNYYEFEKAIKELGLFDRFSMLDKFKLEKSFENIEIDPALMEQLAKFGKKELLQRLYLGKR
ncbi:MAG: PD-(D/E)XK nuclease family protein [archaeon]